MVGWGARGSTKEVLAVAEKLQAPVVHSLKGKAVLDQDNPFWAGGLGLLGTTGGVEAIKNCETTFITWYRLSLQTVSSKACKDYSN